MKSLTNANFVERRTGRVVRGFIRKATELDLLGWATWRYQIDDADRDWDWWAIYAKSKRAQSTIECYATIAGGELHGLTAVDIRRGKRGILVDYLATNPTHRGATNRLKYVGTALIAVAILRSCERGSEGRIWLESLPAAETFYDGLGMRRQQGKSKDGNVVYAFDAETAQQFLEELKQKRILIL